MRRSSAAACALAAALTACGGKSPAPAGWQPVPGSTAVWSLGVGDARQTYAYSKTPFGGTLQDLASREAVNVVLAHHGAKFAKSDVFGPCPGAAAIATYSLGKRTLEEGFSVQSGYAVVALYDRPARAPDDTAVLSAMQRVLCGAPA